MARIIPIGQVDSPQLDVYTHLNENQLRHYYEPHGGLFIAESPTVIERALDAGYEPLSLLIEEKYIDTEAREIMRKSGDVPVYTGDLSDFMTLTGYHLTRGILSAMKRKPLLPVAEVCSGASRIAVLENVENPTNVGAIFRSAAALGMDAVLLGEDCADPLYRRAIRVGVGTVFQVPWTVMKSETMEGVAEAGMETGLQVPRAAAAIRVERIDCHELKLSKSADQLKASMNAAQGTSGQHGNLGENLQAQLHLPHLSKPGQPYDRLSQPPSQQVQIRPYQSPSQQAQDRELRDIAYLQKLGFTCAAMALRHDTISIEDPLLKKEKKLAIVLGNEGEGLPESVINACDCTIRIPMSGGVDSLNVAAASAVAFWELGHRKT